MSTKYIFVTGGVVSGLGKGVCAASLGRLLKARGYRVAMQKFDPYINVDSGSLCPKYHGETFVTEDGGFAGVNVGHYERFVDEKLSVNSNITTGRIYWNVISKERDGKYNGEAVQTIPHITGEIKNLIYEMGSSDDVDIVITDIGGTVGDIESQPFLEAIRQISAEVEPENSIFVHVTLVPFISGSSELKTKPTQHSVKELLTIGIQPNILVCKTGLELEESMRAKIGLFCNMESQDVIPYMPSPLVYEVPLMLEKDGLGDAVCRHLCIENKGADLADWAAMVKSAKAPTKKVKIGFVGKYTDSRDAYLSVAEALDHACFSLSASCETVLLNSENLNENDFCGLDGVVAIGYEREGLASLSGYEKAANICRTKNVPFLGLGQALFGAVLDISKSVAGISDACSAEYCEDGSKVISFLVDAQNGECPVSRRGLYPCKIEQNTKLFDLYNDELVYERHNCSFEINKQYRAALEKSGLVFSAMSPDGHLTEAVELSDKRFFVALQYCPQFASRPNKPHPVFKGFIAATIK